MGWRIQKNKYPAARRRIRAAGVFAILLALLAAGCGQNGEEKKPDTSGQTETQPTQTGQTQPGDTADTEQEGIGQVSATFPTIYADVPDLDIIRVNENYYMVSTTMNLCPGVPVMKSTDLVHWEIVNYVYDTFEDDDITNLENGQDMYGRGSWAASLKYDEAGGLFYVGFSSNNHGFYIYTTDDIENGTWVKHSIREGFHDPALYIEDGNLYVISASGGSCRMQQLKLNDGSGTVEKTGAGLTLFSSSDWSLWEGAHVYRVDDYYYVFIIASPKDRWMRTQVCYRSKTLTPGAWEEKVIYQAGIGNSKAGLAQGGIVCTQFGDWYAFLFQDMGAVGRAPSVISVNWEDGWPMLGVFDSNGKFSSLGIAFKETLNLPDSGTANAFTGSDDFDYKEGEALSKVWQWNHNPKKDYWSVTERPGFYRIKTDQVVDNVYYAHNSLTQRTVGPVCQSEIKLETDGLKPGDYAGLCTVADHYGMIGVLCDEKGDRYIYQANGEFKTAFSEPNAMVQDKLTAEQPVWLRITYQFQSADAAKFSYSLDGEHWETLGESLKIGFSTSTTFMGTRSWLFCYATKEAGGYADFDYYMVTP